VLVIAAAPERAGSQQAVDASQPDDSQDFAAADHQQERA